MEGSGTLCPKPRRALGHFAQILGPFWATFLVAHGMLREVKKLIKT